MPFQGEEFAAVYLTFIAAYLLLMLAPGPNMLLLASVALLRGLRGVVPLVLGLASGAALQLLLLVQLKDQIAHVPVLVAAGKGLATLLLLYVGWRVLTGPRLLLARPDAGARQPTEAGFRLGLVTATTNPLTFSVVLAQFLTYASPVSFGTGALTLALTVFAVVVVRSLIVSGVFALAPVRQAALRREAGVRAGLCACFCALALTMLVENARSPAVQALWAHMSAH
jgi:threonine/homoserine/homoserine lactone efflux protein